MYKVRLARTKTNKFLCKSFNRYLPKGRLSLVGFTLLELLVAIALLAIAILTATQSFAVVSAARAFAYHMSVASNLAQDKLEEMRDLSYTSVSSGSESSIDASAEATGVYDRVWDVQTDIPVPGMKTVSVTVTWPPADSIHSVTLWTIKAQ